MADRQYSSLTIKRLRPMLPAAASPAFSDVARSDPKYGLPELHLALRFRSVEQFGPVVRHSVHPHRDLTSGK